MPTPEPAPRTTGPHPAIDDGPPIEGEPEAPDDGLSDVPRDIHPAVICERLPGLFV